MTRRERHLTRRQCLKTMAAMGLGSIGLSAGLSPTLARAQSPATTRSPITLTILLPEHWKVVEGLRANSKETVPPRRLWFYERVKAFEQARTDIKFNWQTTPWEQIPTNFIAASQAGNPPDIVTFDAGYLYSIARGGHLAPLDGFKYDEWDDFNTDIQNQILTIDGRKYGLSNYLMSLGYIYNKKLLREAGFTEPAQTWDEVVTQGKLLTKDTRGTGRPDRWGFGALMMGQLNQGPPSTFATMAWSQGGQIMGKDRKALIDTAEMRKAVQTIVDLINKHKVMSRDTISIKGNDEIELMRNEVWATGIMGSSYYPPIIEKLGKENVGFTYYPKFPGGQDFAPCEVFAWHMSRKAAADKQRGEAAFEWMKFIAANETLVLAAKYQFGQPSRKSALSLPAFNDDPIVKFLAGYTAKNGRAVPHMVLKEYWFETLMEGVHAAILEQKSVEQALKDAQGRYNARAQRA